ncbi:LPXTG-motif cell wall anchor domain-containing protein [Flavobacterium sinopsychrotolerans]|uniref:Uncharacterized protein n=1 Tax=Flavobacterium sinopsychrotolerans TaxID=604089 RepID=A0A1H8RST5_9FLAO|nr:hypothetical protein SAMN04487942_0146 [Flavobacterium sinopsychrotolerans]
MLNNGNGEMHMRDYAFMGMHMFWWVFIVIILLILVIGANNFRRRK